MIMPRHEPGCSVAGNGLLTSFQCGFFRLNLTLETCRGHSPTLQMASVRSARQHAFTPPKQSEPVTASLPDGASPVTANVCGLPGSPLVTVMVAAFGPKLAGAKRIGIVSELPGPMSKENDWTFGTRNSADEDEIAETVSGHGPLLLRMSGSSAKRPTQTLPKLPLLAMMRLRRGAGAST